MEKGGNKGGNLIFEKGEIVKIQVHKGEPEWPAGTYLFRLKFDNDYCQQLINNGTITLYKATPAEKKKWSDFCDLVGKNSILEIK